jgi:magnesium transporter
MNHPHGNRIQKTWMPPGSLVYIGAERTGKARITAIRYREDSYFEEELKDLANLADSIKNGWVNWINIDGIHDVKLIEELGKLFTLDPLSLEDLLNTHSRPKFEEFEDYVFMIIKDLNEANRGIREEQISFVLKENMLITMQEVQGDAFDTVRNRIRHATTKIRTRGPDYLLFALIDAIVDDYFVATDHFELHLEKLEEKLIGRSDKRQVAEIQNAKREFYRIKSIIAPMREAVYSLNKSENTLIRKKTRIFLRDLHDHVIQLSENLEKSREIVTGLMGIYMSGVNNGLNIVMKTLTVISCIFMALSLIAGIYGMNFQHMPELSWRYSYFVTLGFMACLTIFLIIFFRRKKWL